MIQQKLYKEIKSYKNKSILLALSGGVDSIVLLHAINSIDIKINIHIVHINYHHHINSCKSYELCKKLSNSYNNNFISYDVHLNERNFENEARLYRYKKMHEYANINKINIILTAHHLDDQVETVYMQLLNKADWISKIGIRKINGKVRRPFIDISKSEIINYAKEKDLMWIEDNTNSDLKYYRNKIRNELIPLYNKSNNDLNQKMIAISNKSYHRFIILEKKILSHVNNHVIKYPNYNIINNKIISKYDCIELKLFYQILLKKHFNYLFTKRKSFWDSLYSFIKTSSVGTSFFFDEEISIIKDRENHYLYKNKYLKIFTDNKYNNKIKITKFPIKWYDSLLKKISNQKNSSSHKICLPKNILSEGLFLRHWSNGDVCFSSFYNKHIKLKKILINKKIPIFDKHQIPIFVDSNNEIISIPNIYNRYKDNDDLIHLIWQRNN